MANGEILIYIKKFIIKTTPWEDLNNNNKIQYKKEKKMLHYIYCYTNKITGRKYVGQTNNIKRRKNEHRSNAYNKNSPEYQLLFHKKIRQYGEDSFTFEILETIETNDIEQVNKLESYWIKEKESYVEKNGYNLTFGGDNNEHSRIYDLEKINEIKQLIKQGESYQKIQEKYGISISYISGINSGYHFYNANEQYPLFKYYQSNSELQQIIELLQNSDLKMTEISKITNKAYSTIKKINNGQLHYNKNIDYPIRKQSSQAQQANKIKKALLETKEDIKTISKKFKVSESTVKRINKGITHYDSNLQYPLR